MSKSLLTIFKNPPDVNWKFQEQTNPPTFGHARLVEADILNREVKRRSRCEEILKNSGQFCRFSEGKISLIVLSCKRWHALKRLIDSMKDFGKTKEFGSVEKILVDNGSGPELVENAQESGFFDKIIAHPKNMGMVSALKDAYKKADGEYILLLEDDFVLDYGLPFIGHALGIFDEFPEIGIIRLKNQNNWWKPYRVIAPLRKAQDGTEFWTWLPSNNGMLNVWTAGSVMFRKVSYFAAGELPDVKGNKPRTGLLGRRSHQGYIYECVYARKYNKLWLAAKIKDCYPFFQPNINRESQGWGT